jgi:hypothetical protein
MLDSPIITLTLTLLETSTSGESSTQHGSDQENTHRLISEATTL